MGFKTLQGPHQEAENCKIETSSFLTFELKSSSLKSISIRFI